MKKQTASYIDFEVDEGKQKRQMEFHLPLQEFILAISILHSVSNNPEG